MIDNLNISGELNLTNENGAVCRVIFDGGALNIEGSDVKSLSALLYSGKAYSSFKDKAPFNSILLSIPNKRILSIKPSFKIISFSSTISLGFNYLLLLIKK